MALQVEEFFGYAPLDPAARKHVADRTCPFVGYPCIKPRSGACSVRQISAAEPVICCANRMYANSYAILADIAREAFGANATLTRPDDAVSQLQGAPPSDTPVAVFGRYWGRELPLPQPP